MWEILSKQPPVRVTDWISSTRYLTDKRLLEGLFYSYCFNSDQSDVGLSYLKKFTVVPLVSCNNSLRFTFVRRWEFPLEVFSLVGSESGSCKDWFRVESDLHSGKKKRNFFVLPPPPRPLAVYSPTEGIFSRRRRGLVKGLWDGIVRCSWGSRIKFPFRVSRTHFCYCGEETTESHYLSKDGLVSIWTWAPFLNDVPFVLGPSQAFAMGRTQRV